VKTASQRTPDPAESPKSAKDSPPKKKGPIRRFFGELPGLVIMALVLAILIKTFLFQAFFIPSASMEPTLMGPGDRVLVNKIPYYFGDPQRGDIIVFSEPKASTAPGRGVISGFFHWLGAAVGVQQPESPDFIKRVIGLPGDTVWASGGHVYVNGTRLSEPYLTQPTADFPHTKVPPGDLFVMGDNRSNSLDSRFGLGFVPESKVIGKAFVIIWPLSRIGLLH